jgi:predicted nucleic acid-binding Zn ribbon protein
VTKCEICSGKVKKVFSPPAIIFKGKGFHCTDYKKGSGPATTEPCTTCSQETGSTKSCPFADGKGKCAAS